MIEIITAHYQDIILNTARIFSSVFEVMLAFLLINNYFKVKPKAKRFDYLSFFMISALLIVLQEYGKIGNFKYLLELALLSFLLFLMYDGLVKEKITAIALFAAIVVLSVILAELLFDLFTSNMNLVPNETTPFTALLKITLANIIMIPFAVLISAVKKNKAMGGFVFRMWIGLLLVPAVTLLTFSVFQYIIEIYKPNKQISTYIYISCIGIIVINILVFVLFWFFQHQSVVKHENDILTSQLNIQQNSIKNLENAYNRTRNFRHDIKNHMLTMNILAENNNLEEIKKYLKEMSEILDESSYVRITGISAVDAILNEKLYEAQGESITTNYDVSELLGCNIKALDMCIILSNALDNAIEANKKIDNLEDRYIKLRLHGDKKHTIISVSNPTSHLPIKLGDNSYATSKKDSGSHGFGLKSIESTAKKYSGEMLIKCENNVFTLVIRLCAPDK